MTTNEQFTKTIQIGDMRFGETATPSFPGIQHDAHMPPPLSSFTLKPIVVSLDEAHAQLPFAFTLPTWLPDGFVLDPAVRITLPSQEHSDDATGEQVRINAPPAFMASLHVQWRHLDGRFIGFDVHPIETNRQQYQGIIPIPPGGVVAVQVHQQPAALIMRQYGFNPDDQSLHVSHVAVLRWREYDKQYDLRTRTASVSADELLRIANSM